MSSSAADVPTITQFRTPGPPLSHHVECFWYSDAAAPAGAPRERVLPNGAVQLVFSLRADSFRVYDRRDETLVHRRSGAIATGPSAEFAIIDARDTAATVGVAFKPGRAAAFVGLPPAHFYDQDVDLAAAWGSIASDRAHTRLLEARSPDEAFAVLEDVLLARLPSRLAAHPSVCHAIGVFERCAHTGSIAAVCLELGISHRRFIEVFHRAVGLTPKRFCRIRRFQRVLREAHQAPAIRWTDVAAMCGYSDQAHLIHDFRAFSGLTPAEYTARRTRHQNHTRMD